MPTQLLNALIVFVPALSIAASLGLYWKYRSRGALRALAILPVLVGCVLLYDLGTRVGDLLNPVAERSLSESSDEALALHRSSFVVDLHADSLLFGRDLLERSSVGHLDVPRLLEGGVAMQVFSLVTRQPWGYNEESTDADSPDLITLFAFVNRWPPSTYFDLHERVLYQARRLENMAARSGGRLRLVRDRASLEDLLRARQEGERAVGGLLAIEGAHVLGDDLRSELGILFEQGLRMASLTHFFDTAYAGSVQGLEKGGLTARGRELVTECERLGIAVDLAHASRRTIEDVLAIARKPVVFSHTGVTGTCDQYNNLDDDLIRAIAANGGVVGVGLWDTAVCGTSAADTVRAMRHVIDLVGDAHVGVGSDFDGYVRAHFDATGMPALTQAMLDSGLEPDTIRRILGANALRVLRATLP